MIKFLRRYCVHLVIAAISLAVFGVLFSLFAESVSDSCSVVYRVSTTDNNEIVFSSVAQSEGEGFYNLNGGCYVFTGSGKRVVADVFMEQMGAIYASNTIKYTGSVGGGCAVSANIMHSAGLTVGDTLTCGGVSFTITQKLISQSGTDEAFGYDGVIVLPYDEGVLGAATAFSYVTFMKDGDAYKGLDRLVYTGDLYSDAADGLALDCVIQAVVWAVLIAVCEFFIFKRWHANYNILYGDGVPRHKLYLTIFADMCIKYALPLVVIGVGFGAALCYYGLLYAVPAVLYVAVMLLACAAVSYVFYREVK